MTTTEHQAAYQQRAASECRIERIADRLIDEHHLTTSEWECEDERTDTLADIRRATVREHGLDDCQEDFLRQLLEDA